VCLNTNDIERKVPEGVGFAMQSLLFGVRVDIAETAAVGWTYNINNLSPVNKRFRLFTVTGAVAGAYGAVAHG
jgi:hypothetical protein